MEEEYLTVAEVAKKLRVSRISVQTWCREGKLDCVRAGRLWRISRKGLDAFITRKEVSQEQPPKVNGLAAFAH